MKLKSQLLELFELKHSILLSILFDIPTNFI